MTSSSRKISPTYITTTGTSNIRLYQARATAQVYSTARHFLPPGISNYILPEPEPPSSPPAADGNNQEHSAPSSVDQSLCERFVALDVLRGKDVLLTAKDRGFTIYTVCDDELDLDELCGYNCDADIVALQIIPCDDDEALPRVALLTKTGDLELTLSIATLSTNLIVEHSIILPTTVIATSLIASQHYIALTTPKTVTVSSSVLTILHTIPLPSPVTTGSARWLVYPISRTHPSTPRSTIENPRIEPPLYERVASHLTREVLSIGRDAGEKIGGAISSYILGPSPQLPERQAPPTAAAIPSDSRHFTTLVIHDIPTDEIVTSFQVPYKLGYMSLSPNGTMLFCSPPKGDELYVYSLDYIPGPVQQVATFSRGYTYSRVLDVIWRRDNGAMGVISARGTGHIFSLKRRGKDTSRAISKIKTEGGVKDFIFIPKKPDLPSMGRRRRRSTSPATREDFPDVFTLANTNEKVMAWKLIAPQKSAIGLLTSYFNPPSSQQESQAVPLARPIAEYTLPSTHNDFSFPSLASSPVFKGAFTNQRETIIDCTANAEVENSRSRTLGGKRGIRLFQYSLSTPFEDFGSSIPWLETELDLGIPRGQVHYIGGGSSGSSSKSLETPPSSEQESSPDFLPDGTSKKKRIRRKDAPATGIEKAISATLGTELDKAQMITVPPTPPGSFSTPKLHAGEWVGDILDKGKEMVRNVRRRSSAAHARDENLSFEDGVEVLSLTDAPAIEELSLESSDSAESDGSGGRKVSGDGDLDHWDN